jgi:hypothetical protein
VEISTLNQIKYQNKTTITFRQKSKTLLFTVVLAFYFPAKKGQEKIGDKKFLRTFAHLKIKVEL